MARILVLNSIIPYPLHHNGNSVRVLPLCQSLSREHQLYLAAFGEKDERLEGLRATRIFETVSLLPLRDPSSKSITRYCRPFTGDLDRVVRPAFFRKVCASLRRFVEEHSIDLVIAHTLRLGDYAASIPGIPKILDIIDSVTLHRLRKGGYDQVPTRMPEVLRAELGVLRAVSEERRLTRIFRFVTTVSPVDRLILQCLNEARPQGVVHLPNGISPVLEEPVPNRDEIPNSIVFWGGLDFAPNLTAVDFFYQNVFKKYLIDQGITWYIAGRAPGHAILDLSRRHKNIVVTGELADLFAFVSSIPI
ncbi:MAG: hypothetical protein AB1640_18330, partial [bacterium]